LFHYSSSFFAPYQELDVADKKPADPRPVGAPRATLPNGAPLVPRIGGTFAPPLGPEDLSRYRALAEGAEPRIRDAMLALCDMMERFHSAPEHARQAGGTPHPSGAGVIVPLPEEVVEHLWEHVPWDYEVDAMSPLFDTIDPVASKDLRNAAFHLLWYARELTLDRHPLTSDKIHTPGGAAAMTATQTTQQPRRHSGPSR
jgi:hypothetical protein